LIYSYVRKHFSKGKLKILISRDTCFLILKNSPPFSVFHRFLLSLYGVCNFVVGVSLIKPFWVSGKMWFTKSTVCCNHLGNLLVLQISMSNPRADVGPDSASLNSSLSFGGHKASHDNHSLVDPTQCLVPFPITSDPHNHPT
jgi:hypothetical protein